MRRVLAITLLLAFGFPLVMPLFAATVDSQSSLPSCCRRHGVHRCNMGVAGPEASTAPQLRGPRCPLYPPATFSRTLGAALLNDSDVLIWSRGANRAPVVVSHLHDKTQVSTANLKRGPPTRLS